MALAALTVEADHECVDHVSLLEELPAELRKNKASFKTL